MQGLVVVVSASVRIGHFWTCCDNWRSAQRDVMPQCYFLCLLAFPEGRGEGKMEWEVRSGGGEKMREGRKKSRRERVRRKEGKED